MQFGEGLFDERGLLLDGGVALFGMTDDEFRALRERRVEILTEPYERAVADTVLRLTGEGELDDDAYDAAADQLGVAAIFELTTLVGYYATLALQLRVFRVGVP